MLCRGENDHVSQHENHEKRPVNRMNCQPPETKDYLVFVAIGQRLCLILERDKRVQEISQALLCCQFLVFQGQIQVLLSIVNLLLDGDLLVDELREFIFLLLFQVANHDGQGEIHE